MKKLNEHLPEQSQHSFFQNKNGHPGSSHLGGNSRNAADQNAHGSSGLAGSKRLASNQVSHALQPAEGRGKDGRFCKFVIGDRTSDQMGSESCDGVEEEQPSKRSSLRIGAGGRWQMRLADDRCT